MASLPLPDESDYVPQQIEFAVRGLTNYMEKDEMKNVFGALKSDLERYRYVAKLKDITQVINFEQEFLDKNVEESEKARQDGNKYFKEKSYLTATQGYSKSIVYARQDTKQGLSLAYANRSAAWYHLNRYSLSLADIQLAIEYEYPKELEYKLFDRQGKCYAGQGKKDDATNSFLRAQKCLEVAKLENKQMTQWQEKIKKELDRCKNLKEAVKDSKQLAEKKDTEIKGEPNTTWDKFSSAVSVQCRNDVGRHVVAEEDIGIGEVVMSEKPYASVLLSDHYYNHCYHCYGRPWAPVPCPECASVVYCSHACQQASWDQFHRYECKYQSFLGKFWCGRIGHLAMRIIMVTGLNDLIAAVNEMQELSDEPDSTDVAVKDGKYDNGFRGLYSLSAKTKTRTPEGLFDYSVFSYFIVQVLEKSGWFGAKREDVTEEVREKVGEALIRLLQILQNNSQGITELLQPGDVEKPHPAYIGMGMYSSASLANHSCYANADFTYFGDKLVLRTVREVPKGEEVNVEYLGLSSLYMERKKRQIVLRANFGFMCDCAACKNFYPQWQQLDTELPWFHCVNCRAEINMAESIEEDKKKYVKCQKCGCKQDLNEAVEQLQVTHESYAKGMELMMGGKHVQALPLLAEHLRTMQRFLDMPWRDLAACQGAVRQCYRLMANIRTSFQDCV